MRTKSFKKALFILLFALTIPLIAPLTSYSQSKTYKEAIVLLEKIPELKGKDESAIWNHIKEIENLGQEAKIAAGTPYALRLNMTRAKEIAGTLFWNDEDKGEIKATPEIFGDVVLARKDTPTSYHLSVTVDDHVQGVTLVTRGEDLFSATHIHRLLQALLGLDVPLYRHHDMLTGPDGKRLAKRDKAQTLKNLRNAGKKPQDIRHAAGFINDIDAA